MFLSRDTTQAPSDHPLSIKKEDRLSQWPQRGWPKPSIPFPIREAEPFPAIPYRSGAMETSLPQ